MKKFFGDMKLVGCIGVIALLSACSAEVGSRKWCENMQAKPEGEWTITEAKDYAKHCLFK